MSSFSARVRSNMVHQTLVHYKSPRFQNPESESPPRQTIKIISFKSIRLKSKSTPHAMRILEAPFEFILLPSDKVIGSSRRFLPLRNIIERLKDKKVQQHTRRKSCYSDIWGNQSRKELNFLNMPGSIAQHRKLAGAAEFALHSFSEMFKKQRRHQTRKATELRTQLNRQTYFYNFSKHNRYKNLELDSMERPPSAKSPPKKNLKVQYVKKLSPSQKYVNQANKRLLHYFKDQYQRKGESQTIHLVPPMPTSQTFHLSLFKIAKSIHTNSNTERCQTLNDKSTDRPYTRQNKVLNKLIESKLSKYKLSSHKL